ncbi:hypothetical protein A9K58_04785 [Stenotrophomonas maltophilia]|uniref:Uncharacterized protein n=1 Tax=Stenotrophomonas maltophilia TaxID=40324 RepID=A0A1A6Y267_STEMA|nr:hypothetical protein [Stenotrophomonas maltophilia]OBU69050.1 hypothetical protein A9K58_04785 [Stenotrophomonas maltophilia]
MTKAKCFALAVALIPTLASGMARADDVLYVNYAPDMRYSANGVDSRLVILREKGLFGYGNEFGKLEACQAGGSANCLKLDLMALYRLPDGAKIGDRYKEGEFTFTVIRGVSIPMLADGREVLKVDVAKGRVRANSFYFDKIKGVIGVGVRNFDNSAIPESVFFLDGGRGVFSNEAGESQPSSASDASDRLSR